jgi:hypothetical protein
MKTIIRISLIVVVASLAGRELQAQSGPFQFYPVTPCRVVDTRNAVGMNGGPSLDTNKRDFTIRGNCGVPLTAKAVAINVTVANASAGSWLTIWPADQAQPFVSTINFDTSTGALANGALVAVGSTLPDLSVRNAAGVVNVILDVTGYYQ